MSLDDAVTQLKDSMFAAFVAKIETLRDSNESLIREESESNIIRVRDATSSLKAGVAEMNSLLTEMYGSSENWKE
jgi:hypothetical protein